jgi:putative DNA methylase
MTQSNNTLVRWRVRASGTSKGEPAFDRQIISMTWEFSEGNVFGSSVGSWKAAVKNPLTALNSIPDTDVPATAIQHNAADIIEGESHVVVSTDPPHFDAIGYADLADFFYIWLRKAIGQQHRDIFGTMLVPKDGDLTRDLGRKEVSKDDATESFLARLHAAFQAIRAIVSPQVPLTVYYAFKQAESEAPTDEDAEVSTYSTGWEKLLEGLFQSGLQITGTWPLRTEANNRLRAIGSNALASSIVLVCRPRLDHAPNATRREFVAALRAELPAALRHLQAGNIAPVDLAQAAIGPGMAVYTRHAKVLDAEGKTVSIREALSLINATLDEVLAEQEGDFDADSRWALAWFEQNGFDEGDYGVAETLSKAKNTSVGGLANAGILESRRGKVRLLKPEELPTGWDPATDLRLTSWEVVHHLIRVLGSGGESAAADLVGKVGARAETARELAYRLYTICERKKRAAEALAYNGLVQSWPEIVRLTQEGGKPATAEPDLFVTRER